MRVLTELRGIRYRYVMHVTPYVIRKRCHNISEHAIRKQNSPQHTVLHILLILYALNYTNIFCCVVCYIWRPRKHFISSWWCSPVVKAEILTFEVLGSKSCHCIHTLNWRHCTLITITTGRTCNCYMLPSLATFHGLLMLWLWPFIHPVYSLQFSDIPAGLDWRWCVPFTG